MSRAKCAAPSVRLRPPVAVCRRDDLGVERGKVRRRHHIQRLARHEAGAVGVVGSQAAQVIGCVIPPVLHGQKTLLPHLERRLLPPGMVEAVVVGLRRKGRLQSRDCRGQDAPSASRRSGALVQKFELASGRTRHVQCPVGPGLDEGMGRDTAAQPRDPRAHGTVKVLAGMLCRLRHWLGRSSLDRRRWQFAEAQVAWFSFSTASRAS